MIESSLEATAMISTICIVAGFVIYMWALHEVDLEDLVKGFIPSIGGVIALFCLISCGIGDVGTSRTEVSSNSSTDNSTDNSLHGISQCTAGSTLVCTGAGPGQVQTTQECINADGSPVILQGPDIVTASQAATVCPTPTPAPAPAPVVAG